VKAYVTEFIGTFFLVLTIGLASASGGNAAPLAIASILMVMVYMGGHISGAHYNPAVSVAVLIRGRMKSKDLVPYFIAQFGGAFAGAAIAFLISGAKLVPAPALDATLQSAVVVEALFTFALALVILNVATCKKTEGNSYYGLAIGFTICGAAYVAGGISGGAFNPAVGLGPILFDLITPATDPEAGHVAWKHSWIYLVGPLIGAVGAAFVFKFQHPDDV
jgi:aquaporin Z